MELRPWNELAKLGCVPPRTLDASENIEHTIHDAVRYCMTSGQSKDVRALVEKRLERSRDKARTHYKAKIEEADGDARAELYVDIQFLVLKFGFMHADFEKRGWVTPSEETGETSSNDLLQPTESRRGAKGEASAKPAPHRKTRNKT